MISFNGCRAPAVLCLAFMIIAGQSCKALPSSAVSSGNGNPPDQNLGNSSVEKITLSGRASAAPIVNGTVSVYQLNANGSRGSLLKSTSTGADGSYTVDIPANSGPVIAVVTGGSFHDEATGTVVNLGASEMTAVVSSSAVNRVVSITPITHIAAERAVQQAGSGVPISTAISDANHQIAIASGFTSLQDITSIVPANPAVSLASQGLSTSSMEAKYGLLLAGISQLGKDRGGMDSLGIMDAFAQDFKNDGALDGLDGNTGIALAGGNALAPNTWTTELSYEQSAYLESSSNAAVFAPASLATPLPLYSDNLFTVTLSTTTAHPGDFVTVTIETHDPNYAGYADFKVLNPDGTLYMGGTMLLTSPTGSFLNFPYLFQPSDHGQLTGSLLVATPQPLKVMVSGREPHPRMGVSDQVNVLSRAPYFLAVSHGADSTLAGGCMGPFMVGLKDSNGQTATALGGDIVLNVSGVNFTGSTSAILSYESLADCRAGTNAKTSFKIAQDALQTTVFIKPDLPGHFDFSTTPVSQPAGSLGGEATSPSGYSQATGLLAVALTPSITSPSLTYAQGTCAGPFTVSAVDAAGAAHPVSQDVTIGLLLLNGGSVYEPALYSDALCATAMTGTAVTVSAGQSTAPVFYIQMTDPNNANAPISVPGFNAIVTSIGVDAGQIMTDGSSFSAGRFQYNFQFQ